MQRAINEEPINENNVLFESALNSRKCYMRLMV